MRGIPITDLFPHYVYQLPRALSQSHLKYGAYCFFHVSWRIVSMKGTQLTMFRSCWNYPTLSNNKKKGATKGTVPLQV